MKWYVIHLEYTEYNQFEGSWDSQYSYFDKLTECEDFIRSLSDDEFVAGPLVELKL